MDQVKEKFTFNFKNETINVELLGGVFCAVKNGKAKPLKVEVYADDRNKGKISTHEGKFLSWLPSHALKGNEIKGRITNFALIKTNKLPMFCEICLSHKKENLEVHHIKEHAVTLDDSKKNLRVYCSSCHTIVHAIRTLNRRAVRKFNPEMTSKDYDNIINN
jgi:5-methylcytosine-specific restriction endonuclease McrA